MVDEDMGTIRITGPPKGYKEVDDTMVCKKCNEVPEFINYKTKAMGIINVKEKRMEEGTIETFDLTCGKCNTPMNNLSLNDSRLATHLAGKIFEVTPDIYEWKMNQE